MGSLGVGGLQRRELGLWGGPEAPYVPRWGLGIGGGVRQSPRVARKWERAWALRGPHHDDREASMGCV